jgi:hypothetical protein
MNAQFAEGFASWRRILANATEHDLRLDIFGNAAIDVAGFVNRGLDRIEAVDELQAIAEEIELDADEAQAAIAHAFENADRVPGGNGRDEPQQQQQKPPIAILSKKAFVNSFASPDYLIDGMLQRRFLYTLTGQTGHAKTAVALLLARVVSSVSSNNLGGRKVQRGRVLYLVGENPDDVRMRVIGADFVRSPEEMTEEDNMSFIPGKFDIAKMLTTIEADCVANGPVSLIIVDTSATYFPGDDEINNTEIGNYARDLRMLTTLTGGPCVLVLCHPVKHVTEPSQLLPRGGGAYLAEVDGNLTLWRKTDDTVELDYTKLRGPPFNPITFVLKTIDNCPTLIDTQGRQLKTVMAAVLSRNEAEAKEAAELSDEDAVCMAMVKRPAASGGSFAVWAEMLNWRLNDEPHKKKVERVVDRMSKQTPKLVKKERRSWTLTEEGKSVGGKAAAKAEAALDDADRLL